MILIVVIKQLIMLPEMIRRLNLLGANLPIPCLERNLSNHKTNKKMITGNKIMPKKMFWKIKFIIILFRKFH